MRLATPSLALLLCGFAGCAAKEKPPPGAPLSVAGLPKEETRQERAARDEKPVRPVPVRSADGTPGAAATESQRAGALRLPAVWPAQLSVSYQPDPGLTWPRLARALAGRRAHTTVRPFARLDNEPAEGEVARGGEILALALARQLSTLDWEVLIDGFAIAVQSDVVGKQPKRGGRSNEGRANTASRRVRIEVSGKASFTVKPAAETVARVRSQVSFSVAGRKPTIAAVDVTERVPESIDPVRSQRTELAKKKAVASFIARLFRSPDLELSLAKSVRRAR